MKYKIGDKVRLIKEDDATFSQILDAIDNEEVVFTIVKVHKWRKSYTIISEDSIKSKILTLHERQLEQVKNKVFGVSKIDNYTHGYISRNWFLIVAESEKEARGVLGVFKGQEFANSKSLIYKEIDLSKKGIL